MAFTKFTVTNAGRDLLLACMESGDFQIQSLVLGSGEYSGDKTQIEAVIQPVIEFSGETLITEMRGDRLEVRGKLTNEQMEQGFAWREYGVYATDGTKTVLYCYDNAGEEPVPITAAATGAGISSTIKVILSVDSAATVNVSFQPEPDFVVDGSVAADGENAVSGAAVYAFVEGYVKEAVPEEVPADNVTAGVFAGQVQANEAATAVLTVAQVRNIVMVTEDPGEGATVDYPDGTVIHVYE